MRYLVDTNIFLEGLLGQERQREVNNFFAAMSPGSVFMTKFSLHSIAVILTKRQMTQEFLTFVNDIVAQLQVLDLDDSDLKSLVRDVVPKFNLDFDDAFQYTCAQKYNLCLVSFDRDFDKTDLSRLEPSDAL